MIGESTDILRLNYYVWRLFKTKITRGLKDSTKMFQLCDVTVCYNNNDVEFH